MTVTAGVVEPRYPSFKGIMAAKSKPVDRSRWPTSASTPPSSAGPAPARRSSTSSPAPERQAGEVIEDDGEGHQKIVEFLDGLKVI